MTGLLLAILAIGAAGWLGFRLLAALAVASTMFRRRDS